MARLISCSNIILRPHVYMPLVLQESSQTCYKGLQSFGGRITALRAYTNIPRKAAPRTKAALGNRKIPFRHYTAGAKQPPPKEWYSSEEPLDRYCKGGYHCVSIGDRFKDGRYKVVRKLGYGRYSTIWLARDEQENRYVSIKILTSEWTERTDVVSEVLFLERATEADPSHLGYGHVLTLLDEFMHEGPHGVHICLVTEVLGEDLTVIRREFDGGRMPVELVKQVAKQMLLGLDYLHRSCNIIHTDIKPGNVLVSIDNPLYKEEENYAEMFIDTCLEAVEPEYESVKTKEGELVTLCVSQPLPIFAMRMDEDPAKMPMKVKIVDLGVANWADKHWATVIQSPALRAPEVILGAEWDTSVDVWSVACIIFELLTGDWLFLPRKGPNYSSEHDHLAQMAEIVEAFPRDLLKKGKQTHKFFDETGHLPNTDHPDRGTLEHLVEQYDILSANELSLFLSFLRAGLRLRPEDRAQAWELLEHPWLKDADTQHRWAWSPS